MIEAHLVLDFEFADVIADIVDSEGGVGPIADAILATSWAGVDLLAEQITVRTPVNTGNLSTAISQAKSVDYGDGVWEGAVTDGGVPYGLPVEYGRAPGKMPPVDDIEYWVIRRGIKFTRKLKNGSEVPLDSRQTAWIIAMSIAKRGSKGAHMFREGFRAAEPHLERLWDDLMDEIERIWNEGG